MGHTMGQGTVPLFNRAPGGIYICANCTHFPIFSRPTGPQNGPKLARKCPKWTKTTSRAPSGPKWLEQLGKKLEWVHPCPGQHFWDQFRLSWVPPNLVQGGVGAKLPKMAQNDCKSPQWFKTDGTAWNNIGTCY